MRRPKALVLIDQDWLLLLWDGCALIEQISTLPRHSYYFTLMPPKILTGLSK
jgi:hypothetical protein